MARITVLDKSQALEKLAAILGVMALNPESYFSLDAADILAVVDEVRQYNWIIRKSGHLKAHLILHTSRDWQYQYQFPGTITEFSEVIRATARYVGVRCQTL